MISGGLCILPPLSRCRETNLKVKQALTVTAGLGGNLQSLSSFNGTEGRDAWPAEQPWTLLLPLEPQLWVRVASLAQFGLWSCPTCFPLAIPFLPLQQRVHEDSRVEREWDPGKRGVRTGPSGGLQEGSEPPVIGGLPALGVLPLPGQRDADSESPAG